MSVLPYDIRWLGGFDQEELIAHEFKFGWEFRSTESVFRLKLLSNDAAVFLFESDEGIAWLHQISEMCIFQISDLLFHLYQHAIVLLHNVLAPCLQQVYQLCIIECEHYVCYLHFINLNARSLSLRLFDLFKLGG